MSYDYIISDKNKEFLWNILYEKKIFNGISNDKLDNVKYLFDNVVNNVANSTNKSNNRS